MICDAPYPSSGHARLTAVALQRGKVVALYRKTHLLKGELSIFAAGTDYPVFDAAGTKIGINIC